MNLKAEQKRLYELLANQNRCFVRICAGDDALWVSDLPRKTMDLSANLPLLLQNGFACRVDERAKLLYVDWTQSMWTKALASFSPVLPALPQHDRYHAAYALCRLWITHPSDLAPAAMPAVRRMLKLVQQPEEELLKSIASLHEEAAVQLRTGQPVAHAAGWILAQWLNERSQNT